MIFESENYSPIERVNEELRRRVLDDMDRWSNASPAVSRRITGCPSGQSGRAQGRSGGCSAMTNSRGASPRCGSSEAVGQTDAPSGAGDSCIAGCTESSPSLAMVYSPRQQWGGLYCVSAGLDHGTIFRELNFPFYPTPCLKGGSCNGR